jgi:hypothetical protein
MRPLALVPLLLFHCLPCTGLGNVADASSINTLSVKAVARDRALANTLVSRQDDNDKPPLLANATQTDIETARALVKTALQQVANHNKARLDKPLRNNYQLKPGTKTTKMHRRDDEAGYGPPLYNITDEIAAAAALIAEVDTYEDAKSSGTLRRRWGRMVEKRNRASKFWLGNTKHVGSWPFGNNGDGFVVFRDVTDPKYGAKGDGVTVSTYLCCTYHLC